MLRDIFWEFFTDMLYNLIQVRAYKTFLLKRRYILDFTCIAAALVFSALAVKTEYSAVCAMLVLLSQVALAFAPKYGYEKAISSLEICIPELTRLNNDIDAFWVTKLVCPEVSGVTDEEILDTITRFKTRYTEIESIFLAPIELPQNERLYKKCEKLFDIEITRYTRSNESEDPELA